MAVFPALLQNEQNGGPYPGITSPIHPPVISVVKYTMMNQLISSQQILHDAILGFPPTMENGQQMYNHAETGWTTQGQFKIPLT